MKFSRTWMLSILFSVVAAACLLRVSAVARQNEASARDGFQTVARLLPTKGAGPTLRASTRKDAAAAPAPKPSGAFGDLPLAFEENRGQSDSRVKYLARGKGYTLFLTPGESVMSLRYAPANSKEESDAKLGANLFPAKNEAPKWSQAVLKLQLAGASQNTQITGAEKLEGITNYFIGNEPAKWHTGIPNYRKVIYRNAYPDIDIAYYGNPGMLETDFVVAPGADPRAIAWRVKGAEKIHIDEAGDVVLETSAGAVCLHKPIVYQEIAGARREIAGNYLLRGKDGVAFSVGAYDKKQPLIIDPTLVFSTYLGGSNAIGDAGQGIAVDSLGQATVTGFTNSADFPQGSTPVLHANSTIGGGQDAFVTKYNAAGSAFIFSTFLGGSGTDQGNAVALNTTTGDILVTGFTQSTNFPTLNPLAGQQTLNGFSAGFLTKIKADGSTLLFSTYLGGNGSDTANGVAVDNIGDAYLVGTTNSTNFPNVAAFQATLNGSSNAFVTKIKGDGSAIIYSSFLGGNLSDFGNAIAVDPSGNAYVTGDTNSTVFNLKNPIQGTFGGGSDDAFVAEVSFTTTPSPQSSLVYSTYLGGSASDLGNGIAVDSNGTAYVTGFTQSLDFPQNLGTPSLQAPDGFDAFLAKIAPNGASLAFATYWGSSIGGTLGSSIALDSSKNIFVGGQVFAGDLPTRDPLQTAPVTNSFAGMGFITEFLNNGSDFAFSTYLGGSTGFCSGTQVQALAIDPTNNIYVAGTVCQQLDFPTVNPKQASLGSTFPVSNANAFVSKISPTSSAGASVYPASLNLESVQIGSSSSSQTATLQNGTNVLTVNSVSLTGPNASDFTLVHSCGPTMQPNVTCQHIVTFKPTAGAAGTRTASVVINDSAGIQNISLTGNATAAPPPPTLGTISLAPSPVPAFPATEVGTTSAVFQNVTVTNTGTVAVQLQGFSFGGTNPGDYSAQSPSSGTNCFTLPSQTLNIGANCAVGISFHPQAAGPSSATLQVFGTITPDPATDNVSGTGTPPIAVLSTSPPTNPPTLSFGNQVINITSAAQIVTLANTSNSVTLTNINAFVSGSPGFAISMSTCGASLGPGLNCQISITFTPLTTGFQSAALVVMDSDPASPQFAFLNGFGLNANATLAPIFGTNLSFGRQTVGTSTFAKGIFLTNIGNVNLSYTLVPGGSAPGDYVVTDDPSCNGVITPTQNCFPTVVFLPTATGPRTAFVTIQSSTPGATGVPQVINLFGTGIPATTVDLEPSPTLTFPNTSVGNTSALQFAFFSNTGTQLDRNLGVFIAGANPGDFLVDFTNSTCTQAFFTGLDGEGSCNIGMRFAPTAAGPRTAILQVFDTAPGSPHQITLQGNQSTLSFTTTTLSSGIVNLPYGQMLQVTGNQGSVTFALTLGTPPAGLSLNTSTGLINGTPTTAGTSNFTVKATDSANNTTTGNFSITINPVTASTAAQLALLNGRYGFLRRGTNDPSTSIEDDEGSVNFDGLGNFTGIFDQNSEGGNPATQCNVAGTYSVGADNRALLRSTSIGPCVSGSAGASGVILALALGDVKNGVAASGRFIDFDDNGLPGSGGLGAGFLERQNPAAFTSASLPGTYVLGLTGQDTVLGRTVELALTTINNSLMIPSGGGSFDLNDNGTLISGTVTGSFTAPDANGHTVLTATVNGNMMSIDSMYIVSANEVIIMTLDPTASRILLAGQGFRQFNPNSFGLSSLTGPDIVSVAGPSASGTSALIGVATANVVGGVGHISVTSDKNEGGTVTLGQVQSGTYTMASIGRAVFTGLGSQNQIAYFIRPDRALLIGEDPSDPPFGEIAPQIGGPFSASPFINNFFFGQRELVPNGQEDLSGVAVLAPSNNLNATFDNSHSGGSLTLGGSIGISYTVDATGHFVGSDTNGGHESGYAISPFEAAFFETSNSSGPSVHPALTIAESIPLPPGVPSPATPAVNFATPVAIGSSALSSPLTITNAGVGPLQFATLINAADFSASGSCVTGLPSVVVVLDPGQTCQVTITFAPTASTPTNTLLNEMITVTTDPSTNLVITATGTALPAPAPGIQFTPGNSLAFNNQAVGTTSAQQTITVTNNGNLPLNIATVAPGGANPGDFTIVPGANTCANGTVLQPNANCLLPVTFAPTAGGARSATVTFTDNAPSANSQQVVTLTGTGLAAGIQFTPGSSLNFNSVLVGTTSGQQTITVTNNGTNTLTISNFAETGNAADFPVAQGAGDCTTGTVLLPNANCAVVVQFSPQAPGNRNATVTLTDNAPTPGSMQTLTFTGTGTAPAISPSVNSINFGGVAPTTTSPATTVTVTNSGTAPLHINNISITGTDHTDFNLVPGSTCLGTAPIAPNGTCTVGVTFTPPTANSFNAALTIMSDAFNAPTESIPLAGSGALLQITPAPGTSTTVTVSPGGTAVFPLVMNTNGFTGTVTLGCTSSQPTITCSVAPPTVQVTPNQPVQTAISVNTFCAWTAPPGTLPSWPGNGPLWPIMVTLAGLSVLVIALAAKRERRLGFALAMVALVAMMGAGCGSLAKGPAGRTPPGTYTITITATAQGITQSLQLTLNVL
ncbi:MAG: choice-of-anchor D domain-containing protein [Candidatus Acidiferrales bacterium]